MKKLSLILLLLVITGCATVEDKERWERDFNGGLTDTEIAIRAKDCKASLEDSRVYIGMTAKEFVKIWVIPQNSRIDSSTSAYGVTEWLRYDNNCNPNRYGRPSWKYNFCFVNGILDYWSED